LSASLSRRSVLLLAFAATLTIPIGYRLIVTADTEMSPQRQQDRSITPAGKLIIDASNGLPAVAPLTMNFVRTPDTSGPDG
jgi:hypothetical protein